MRVAIAGGGPGGLFLAALLRKADPTVEVTVFERNRADDTFGFGVVFSDRTLAAIDDADPVLRNGLTEHGVHWDDIEVRLKGDVLRCGGNGMAAISRKVLLGLLQERARSFGTSLEFSMQVSLADLAGYDLVVAADGTGSTLRDEVGLSSTVDTATAKFIWFGTDYRFSGLTFVHERGPHGVFAVHGYPISSDISTFIVETDEESWLAAGLDGFDVTQPPGPSDLRTKAYLEELFADQIDGAKLLTNNSRWGNFRTRRSPRWTVTDPRPVAFLGDAVHTAHFSVGSGTKMAMEDAIALSAALVSGGGDLPGALAAYEAAARPSVEKIQGSARPSLAWWEHFGRYHDHFAPWQFAYHFLSRSITDKRLARRAPDFVASSHEHWVAEHGAEPLETSLTLGDVSLPGRLVTAEPAAGGFAVRPAFQQSHFAATARQESGFAAIGVEAPDDESGLPGAFAQLVGAGAGLVAVHGGTPFTRTLVCEEARMQHGLTTLLVDEDLDEDAALTAVLSGRTDLVTVKR
ncbi:MAG: FAD-dependent monooxygenase [Pseudonocardia sp.]|nr:FAD-dependent monooxygenase [Pseudonocardia sp.]